MLGLFAGFVLAYPGSVVRRMLFIPLGVLVIYKVNVGRLVTLAASELGSESGFKAGEVVLVAIGWGRCTSRRLLRAGEYAQPWDIPSLRPIPTTLGIGRTRSMRGMIGSAKGRSVASWMVRSNIKTDAQGRASPRRPTTTSIVILRVEYAISKFPNHGSSFRA